ncbi:MAG: type II toxin-antitoxin system VapC family toxin [Flavobacteriales bacterium]|nr:type II toxin-antitoxin system VapC family toxin [Flavobacteriales bacterium]
MDVLLDTHILLWAWSGDKRLTKAQRELIASEEVRACVSIVPLWEIAIKSSLGKLELMAPLDEMIASLPEFEFHLLHLRTEHVQRVTTLPLHHRDPFDRMLIAQAKHEGMHLLTADPHFAAYGVPVIAA